MKKFYSLILLSVLTCLGSNAQDLVFVKGSTVLDDNANVTIKAELIDDEGFYTCIASTNGTKAKTEQYFLKNNTASEMSVSATVELISTTLSKPGPTWCLGGQCAYIFPADKALTIAANSTQSLELDQDYVTDWTTAPKGGKTVMKMTAKAGTQTRTMTFNFEYNDNASIEGITADATAKVTNNNLVYSLKNSGNYTAHVYSISGQELLSEPIADEGTISLANLGKGLYIYSIQKNGHSIVTEKCVIK